MFSKKSLILVLVINCLSISNSLNFCSKSLGNKLIDSLFTFEDTVYALQLPNVFILTKDENGKWIQTEEPIPLKRIFNNFPRLQFSSGFSVTNFIKCDLKTVQSCPYESPEFDATNITFLFYRNQYFIYRRINRTFFEAIDWTEEEKGIPWRAQMGSASITELLDEGLTKVDAAIYRTPFGEDSPKRSVLLLDYPKMFEFSVSDAKSIIRSNESRKMMDPNFSRTGNGGFVDQNGDIVIIFDNELYRYVKIGNDRSDLQDMQTTTWDYFNCDSMPPFTTTTIVSNGTENPLEIISSISSETKESEPDLIVDPKGTEFTPPENEDTEKTNATRLPSIATTKDKKRFTSDGSQQRFTSTGDSIISKIIYDDQEYGRQLRTLLVITLSLLGITVIFVSILAVICFSILS